MPNECTHVEEHEKHPDFHLFHSQMQDTYIATLNLTQKEKLYLIFYTSSALYIPGITRGIFFDIVSTLSIVTTSHPVRGGLGGGETAEQFKRTFFRYRYDPSTSITGVLA